jgi:hypothetical protein
MGIQAKRSGTALVVLSAITAGSVGVAQASPTTTRATAATTHQRGSHHAGSGDRGAGRTAVTGATLQSVSSAATTAVPGATVEQAWVTHPGNPSGAAYAVLVKKTDGSQAIVLEGTTFDVLTVNTPAPRPSGTRRARTPLTGATLTSASAAALATIPGATVTRAVAVNPSAASGVAYAVVVRRTDGAKVVVLENSAFAVLSDSSGRTGRGRPGR